MKTPTPAGEWAFLTRIDGKCCLAASFGDAYRAIVIARPTV